MKKHFILTLFCFLFVISLKAQNDLGKTEDLGRISLTPVIADDASNMNAASIQLLKSKLQQIATQNGLAAGNLNPRFIITAKVNIVSKDIVAGPPQMVAQNVEALIYIVDYNEQKVFSSISLNLKGVGIDENKSLMSAFKNIKPQSQELQKFVESGKSKIIEYYNAKCDLILFNIQSLVSQKKFEEAIQTLSAVPEVCKECYTKSQEAMGSLYNQYTNYLCDQNMAKARSAWSAGMNKEAAKDAGQYLAQIYPDAKCYGNAQDLYKEIKETLKDQNALEMKNLESKATTESQKITLLKQAGMAFANNQTPTTYNLDFLH